MDLGDKHQTTPREASNDPGNDNLNALKNAHLTPRAIKAVQRGVDIKNEDSTEDSTTDGRKKLTTPKRSTPKPAPTPAPKPSTPSSTPKPRKVISKPSEAPRSVSKAPKPIRRIKHTQKKEEAPQGYLKGYISFIDLL